MNVLHSLLNIGESAARPVADLLTGHNPLQGGGNPQQAGNISQSAPSAGGQIQPAQTPQGRAQMLQHYASTGIIGLPPQGFMGGGGYDNQAQNFVQGSFTPQGFPNLPQGGQYNPGYIPMQGSTGPVGNAYGMQNAYNFNPYLQNGNITF